MDLEVRHLRLVQAIAEEGTQTRAARRLFLTQSALSHQLAELERRLGTPLFHRLGRRMTPTPAGRTVLDACEAILPRFAELAGDLRALARGVAGVIRLTTQCYTCYHWLPQVLPSFRRRYPQVEIRIVPEAANRAIEGLREGGVDLALAYDFTADDQMIADRLWTDEMVAICAPDHPFAARGHVDAPDFKDIHLLIHMDRIEDTYFHRAVLDPAGVRPQRVSPLRLTEGIVSMVAGGAGVAVVTRWSVARELAAGLIRAVRVTEFGLRRDWHAVRLSGNDANVALRSFIEELAGGPSRLFDDPGQEAARVVAGIVRSPA